MHGKAVKLARIYFLVLENVKLTGPCFVEPAIAPGPQTPQAASAVLSSPTTRTIDVVASEWRKKIKDKEAMARVIKDKGVMDKVIKDKEVDIKREVVVDTLLSRLRVVQM